MPSRRTPPPELSDMLLDAGRFVYSDRKSWRGPCPKCGGSRRFVVFTDREWPHWYCMCDTCGWRGWADQLNPRLNTGNRLDAAMLRKQYEQDMHDEIERRSAVHAAFLSKGEDKVKRWHDAMGEAHRQWWRSQGVPDEWQDFWQLGWMPSRPFEHNGQTFNTQAYTIPKFGLGWGIQNVDYRLVDYPEGAGKYRPEMGIAPAVFLSRPDLEDISVDGMAIVVEGSKKAMVTCLHIDGSPQIIGVPSCNSWAGIETDLARLDTVYVVMDPDAQRWANIKAREIGKAAKVVSLPVKIDDAFISYGLSGEDLRHIFRQARPVV